MIRYSLGTRHSRNDLAFLQASLRDLKCVWAPFMDQHAPKTCRILLAGTKAEPPQPGVRRREVSVEQAKVNND